MTVRLPTRFGLLFVFLGGALAVGNCSSAPTPTFFLPPSHSALIPAPAGSGTINQATASTASPVAIPTLILPSPTPVCTNSLTYLRDLTIPDGSNVTPGQLIEKEWQVQNSGSCGWDQRYRLKLMSGDAMGANALQPLYPARPGTQVTLRIVFTAPQTAGLYACQWRAVDPDGLPFGDAFYMQISVAP